MKKQLLISFLYLFLSLFLVPFLNAETGATLYINYHFQGTTIYLSDNSVITETDTNVAWNIYWQVKTDDTTYMVEQHTKQRSDSIFTYTYPQQTGTYTVNLIYEKVYPANPEIVLGEIRQSVGVAPIYMPLCINPTIATTYLGYYDNEHHYLFNNITGSMVDSNLHFSYMWLCSDGETSYDQAKMERTIPVGDTFLVKLVRMVSTGDSTVCMTMAVNTLFIDGGQQTGVKELQAEDIKVYWNGSRLVVKPQEEIKQVYIYNLLGEIVDLNEGVNKGLYIVCLKTNNSIITTKKMFLGK